MAQGHGHATSVTLPQATTSPVVPQDIDAFLVRARERGYEAALRFGKRGLNLAATAAVQAATKVPRGQNPPSRVTAGVLSPGLASDPSSPCPPCRARARWPGGSAASACRTCAACPSRPPCPSRTRCTWRSSGASGSPWVSSGGVAVPPWPGGSSRAGGGRAGAGVSPVSPAFGAALCCESESDDEELWSDSQVSPSASPRRELRPLSRSRSLRTLRKNPAKEVTGGGDARRGRGAAQGVPTVPVPFPARALPGSCAAGPGGERLSRSRTAENAGKSLPGGWRGICRGIRRELRRLAAPGVAPAALGILPL
ncbi:hypothetical protein DV515_00019228 [Chloebia gouldiae]|uniref:Uncharacterized protein n=1 Tax=Chloebia gouldiae TaxID=44316 RepID=A0A3L8Q5B6_CHLGU|nr:hypothetical protein DV515_00019228 [Chloebia gouldiae]